MFRPTVRFTPDSGATDILIPTGQLHLPSTTIYLAAYIFADHELADNLVGLAPLVNQGFTATFSNTKVSFDAPTTAGSRTILYGTKHPSENVWYSRRRPRPLTSTMGSLQPSRILSRPFFEPLPVLPMPHQ